MSYSPSAGSASGAQGNSGRLGARHHSLIYRNMGEKMIADIVDKMNQGNVFTITSQEEEGEDAEDGTSEVCCDGGVLGWHGVCHSVMGD
jgi:hypothetical protein